MSLVLWLEAVEDDLDLRRGWHVGVDLVEEAARLNRAVPLVAAANHRSDVETRIWRPNLPVIHLASAVQKATCTWWPEVGMPMARRRQRILDPAHSHGVAGGMPR